MSGLSVACVETPATPARAKRRPDNVEIESTKKTRVGGIALDTATSENVASDADCASKANFDAACAGFKVGDRVRLNAAGLVHTACSKA